MNPRDIEGFKSALMGLLSRGCKVNIPSHGISGRIVGIGFKPYWTGPADSKIEKLELNIFEDSGRLVPFSIFNIIDYKIISRDPEKLDIRQIGNLVLEIIFYTPNGSSEEGRGDKVRIELSVENKKEG